MSGNLPLQIIRDIKKVTRRLMVPQPKVMSHCYIQRMHGTSPPPNPVKFGDWKHWRVAGPDYPDDDSDDVWCPYQVGDQIYIRETHYRYGHWEPVMDQKTKSGKQKWQFVPDSEEVRFDPPNIFKKAMPKTFPFVSGWYKRLARFMPAACARTVIEITGIRAERIQEITKAEILAEGIEVIEIFDGARSCGFQDSRLVFIDLWESLHGEGSWKSNPWVWVFEFKMVKS